MYGFISRRFSSLKTSLPLLMRSFESTVTSTMTPSTTTENPEINPADVRQRNVSVLGHDVPRESSLYKCCASTDRAYHELAIVHITATRNNTKVSLSDCNGRSLACTSCGVEGFRNARKQTTVAAQTVGISIGLKALKLGIRDVRVIMRGLGSNRVSTLSGMTLSGLNVVSITDDTPIHYGMGRRPKKLPKK